MNFIVIGINDCPEPFLSPEVMEIIRNGKVFSGGKRHHEIVAPLLPQGAEWIDITVPVDAVFEQYISLTPHLTTSQAPRPPKGAAFQLMPPSLLGRDGEGLQTSQPLTPEIIVFASGDPLFFGFANTIRRKMPDAGIRLYPSFNSLQMLAHRLVMPYHDMRIVSLTGRPWQEFDRALIEEAGKIGILTDREHTPAAIARRMTEYGYTDYIIYIGEHLGNPSLERVTRQTLEEAAQRDFTSPNCVIVAKEPGDERRMQKQENPLFGIPDKKFALLDGREKMITKMPIRLLTLQAMELPRKHVLWDIGACTGSVSIEARRLFPHLQIEAFEIRPECEDIIEENTRRFGTPGINIHIGDFLEADIKGIPRPDAVFIGGHGGRLRDILAKVLTVLADNGCIVMNSVKAPKVLTDSYLLWNEACRELGLQQEPATRIVLDENHPIVILKAHK